MLHSVPVSASNYCFIFAIYRCFPQCRETGHCKSGFCGTSLKSRLTINIERKSLPPGCGLDAKFWESDHVTYIAEIRESLTPGLSTERFVTRQYIESQLRTKPEKFKALIEGKPTQVQTVQSSSQSETNIVDLEFNSHCQAWHYGIHSDYKSHHINSICVPPCTSIYHQYQIYDNIVFITTCSDNIICL